MPDPTDAEQKIARLEAQIAALKAQLQGSGGLAQGIGNVAGGEGSVVAGRDVNFWSPPPTGASEEDLRCAYLHRLVYLTRPLALSGVDPALASGDRDARLSLDAVLYGPPHPFPGGRGANGHGPRIQRPRVGA